MKHQSFYRFSLRYAVTGGQPFQGPFGVQINHQVQSLARAVLIFTDAAHDRRLAALHCFLPCRPLIRPVAGNAVYYERHRPEQTLLYPIVAEYYPAFQDLMAAQGRALPEYVQREFEDYLRCGRLEHGFLRVRCERCHAEKLVAFSCKRRGFCPSCGARRMVESAALLVDEVLPREPLRQWVLSVPFALRFRFASQPAEMGKVLGIVYRTIATHLIKKAGLTHATGQTGAVTLIQRFGSALNLNIHFDVHGGTNAAGAGMRRSGPHVVSGWRVCHRRGMPCVFGACSRRQRRNWLGSSGTSARALDATWNDRACWCGIWTTAWMQEVEQRMEQLPRTVPSRGRLKMTRHWTRC